MLVFVCLLLVFVACSRGGKAFMINHFEAGQPGSMYKTTLTKDRDGVITVRDTEVSSASFFKPSTLNPIKLLSCMDSAVVL